MRAHSRNDSREPPPPRTVTRNHRPAELLRFGEQALLMLLWFVLIMGLFFPWENFVSPTGDALGDSVGKDGFGVSHAVIVVSYLSILSLGLLRWKAVVRTLWLVIPIILLCAWMLLTTSFLPDPGKSGIARYFVIIILCAYLASRFDPAQFVGFLTKGFALMVVASLAVMVVAPKLGLSNIGGAYVNAWRGAFTHKNWLGAAMSLGVLVSAYSYAIGANRRILSASAFLGCLFLLVMSRSATALFATLVSGLVAAVGIAVQSTRSPVFRALAFTSLFAAACMSILFPLFDVGLRDLPQLIGRSSDLTGRTELWHAVSVAIKHRPMTGYGYGFWDQPSVARTNIWLAANWEAPHAHNNWLDARLQIGWVGLALTVLIWISALRRAVWLVLARFGHGSLLYLAILANCLCRSFVETVTFSPALVSLFWWVISCMYLARLHRQYRATAKETSIPERRLPVAPARNRLVVPVSSMDH